MILLFGALLIGCCSIGLFIVRLTNPRLKGLGWLGGAFTTGCIALALLYLAKRASVVFSVLIADVLVLAAFSLLQLGAEELVGAPVGVPILSLCLLIAQVITDIYVISGPNRGKLNVIFVGLLVAVQTGQTAFTLTRRVPLPLRVPALFTGLLLAFFAATNLIHSAAQMFGLLEDPVLSERVELANTAFYVAVALGIGFGFFWMTTSLLTAELDFLSSTDPLTRIFNRRVFLLWCEKERQRSDRTGLPFSILVIDLDHFKQLNDQYGHEAGDFALCAVVERMQDSIRGLDILGRWGGEEFVALLPAASPAAALMVGQRMCLNIEKILLPGVTDHQENVPPSMKVTVSIGVSTYRGRADTVSYMLRRADSALYKAKAAGRNQVLASS